MRGVAIPFFIMMLAAGIAAGCGNDAEAEGEIVIHVTSGRDPTGWWPKTLERCSKASKGKWRLAEVMLPASVDAQREQIIRRLAGKDDTLDILQMDVIWTAEFSEAGWIHDLTDRVSPIENTIVPAALKTARYDDKIWALPAVTNVALMYYRTDIIDTPPKTWQEMKSMADAAIKKNPDMAGYVWQANQYEGLTVDALEVMHAAGAEVLDPSGKKAILNDTDAGLKSFEFMRSLFDDGTTPRAVTTFQEEEARQLFSSGKAVFMRNWPYVYALANIGDSPIKGKFDVTPLPQFEGAGTAAVLGGGNLGISTFSKHPDEAWEAMQCLASEQTQLERLLAKGDMPALIAPYKNAEALKKYPFLPSIEATLTTAKPRPTSPYYNDVTIAINRPVHEMLAGHMDPADAVEEVDRKIQLAVIGKGEL